MVLYVALVEQLALKALQAVQKSDGPRTWAEHLETLEVLAEIIPSSAVEAVIAEAKELEWDGCPRPQSAGIWPTS